MFASAIPRQVLCRTKLGIGGDLSARSHGEGDPVPTPSEHPILASCGLLWSVKEQRLPCEVISGPQDP